MGIGIFDFSYRTIERFANRYRSLMPRTYHRYGGHLVAVALVSLALLVRFEIAPLDAGLQYLTFFPAVALAAIIGGFASGIIATLLGLILATYLFVPPYYSFTLEGWQSSLWSNLVFLMDGFIVSVSIEAMHLYRQKYEDNLDELTQQITRRDLADKALAEQEEFFRLMAENVEDFIAVLDLQGRRLYNSPSYSRFFGNADAMKGTDSFAEIHPDDRERVKQVFSESVKLGVGLRTEYRFVLPDGSIRDMESSGGLIRNSKGETVRVVVVSHDVTDRKMVEQKINRLAFYDSLTQLPNRRLLDDRLEQAIAASKRSGQYGAVMFLDLDNFKPLNDNYGHRAGDLLLIEVAKRITSCVREVDTVARFGGDEFVVVLSELAGNESESAAEAKTIAKKIHAALAEPYWLSSNFKGTTQLITHNNVGASIGVVLFNHGDSAENILKRADKSMYQAKAAGRNQIHFHVT